MTSRQTIAGLGMLAAVAAGVGLRAQADWQDVLRNLRHPNADTRLRSVNALADAAYSPAADAVAPLVVDPDDRVQSAAIEAELTFFLTERINSLRVLSIGSSRSRAQQAFDAGPLIRGATPAPAVLIERLLTAVRDENPRVRFDAIHAVGFIAERPLTPAQGAALTDELDHYDPIIRAAAARVIGRLRTREAADKLLAGVTDSNSLVRQYAIEALGYLREERALLPLRDIVTRNRGDLVDDAWIALARIGVSEDIGRFRQGLTNRSAIVRRGAAEGLGRAHDKDSMAALQGMLKADSAPTVKLAAAFGLQQLGDLQTHTIASMLMLREEGAQARDYLFEIGREAIPGILSVLKVATDSRHRADLVQMIGYVGTAEDAAIVEPFARDRDERIARAAGHAIARLRR